MRAVAACASRASLRSDAQGDLEWRPNRARLIAVTRFMSQFQEVAKMTKRMVATIAGLGLLATTMTACSTLVGAGVGAGTGAAIGAGTGYGAGKGALIGTGVGAAAGAIYGATKK